MMAVFVSLEIIFFTFLKIILLYPGRVRVKSAGYARIIFKRSEAIH